MDIATAKNILNDAYRHELRDHAFGDREVFWTEGPETDSEEVADGYFGGGHAVVGIGGNSWKGREARELSRCGRAGRVERNDSTGPARYQDGACMPGLTLEGVKEELTGQ